MGIPVSAKSPQPVRVHLVSGEVLLDLPDAPKSVEDLVEALVSKVPPPAGTSYQLAFKDNVLDDKLPTINPLNLTAVICEAWSGIYQKRSIGYGGGARVARYHTHLSFKSDGSVSFTASGSNGLAGTKKEACGSWKAGQEIGSVIVRLNSVRQKSMGYRGNNDWTEWSQMEHLMSYSKEENALRLVASQVVVGADFDMKHSCVGAVFEQVSELEQQVP
eukprot:gnl/MRDRNA2_/MRDRNA2_113203_c0_seq1.p1 gnl/MRDRNA2_/MRDRNA2_113203_c0~~gnl/MRDRNA2_/MRDRNA2_113203_c0_seq1.p1  ORF type:complete len:218 (+),score=42.38 gnl/MRDRNA2_/MRDRNA2_113203_c0_seq1:85-738(+)